jgi:hypothetical protein
VLGPIRNDGRKYALRWKKAIGMPERRGKRTGGNKYDIPVIPI